MTFLRSESPGIKYHVIFWNFHWKQTVFLCLKKQAANGVKGLNYNWVPALLIGFDKSCNKQVEQAENMFANCLESIIRELITDLMYFESQGDTGIKIETELFAEAAVWCHSQK